MKPRSLLPVTLMLLSSLAACGARSGQGPGPGGGAGTAESDRCRAQGGAWVQFTNGCRDDCAAARAEAQGLRVTCTQDTPMGCDCGPSRCWDGAACVANPPAQPAPELPAATLPPDCQRQADPAPVDTAAAAARIAAGSLADLRCTAGWVERLLADTRALGDHPVVLQAAACLEERSIELRALTTLIEGKQALVEAAAGRGDKAAAEAELPAVTTGLRQARDRVPAVQTCLAAPR